MPASDRLPVRVPEDEEPEEQAPSKWSRWRNLIAFWLLGLCNNYGYVVMLSAAHDILARHDPNQHADHYSVYDPTKRDCNYMSTGAILLADVVPSLLTKIIAPFFPLWIHGRMLAMIVLSCAGYILVGASQTQWVALLGVVCTAFASGLGETSLLAYMPFFNRGNVISTWSSGTGGAGILGSFSYAFLISQGLSPSTTLYVMLVVPLLMGITFWVILDRPNLSNVVRPAGSSEHIPTATSNASFREKLAYIPPLIRFMVPIGLVYLFEYFINQGLFELIYFGDTKEEHASQYRYYQVLYQIGVFISRSSIAIIQLDKIWLMAVLQCLNVIFFTCEALWPFMPNQWLVFGAVLWEGLLGGAAYVNTFHKINTQVDPEKREFSMGITSLADALGITLAGFLSMPVHNYICGLPRPAS